MWFLLNQIFFLLLLAALLGAVLTYWWMRRRYQDVTEAYDLLAQQAGASPASAPLPDLATRTELEARFDALTDKLDTLDVTPAAPDLSPIAAKLDALSLPVAAPAPVAAPSLDLSTLHERLARMEAILKTPNRDTDALHETLERRFAEMDDALAGVAANVSSPTEAPDLGGVEDELKGLAERVDAIPATDLNPLDARLMRVEESIRSYKTPEIDLGPVHSALARLDLTLSEMKGVDVDLAPVKERMGELETRLDTARKDDAERIAGQLAALTASVASLSTPDLAPVQARLQELADAVARLPKGEANLDPVHEKLNILRDQLARPQQGVAAIHDRLAALDASLAALGEDVRRSPGMDGVQSSLSNIQDALAGLRAPDLTPVVASMRSMESRVDMGAMENRLTAIEYGLAAIHHMLRTRPETQRQAPTYVAPPQPAPQPTVSRPPVPQPAPQAPPPQPVQRPAPPPQPTYAPTVSADYSAGYRPYDYEMTRAATAPRSAPAVDPINTVRRTDAGANLLTHAAFGGADDLEQISGVGPMLRELLNEIGVFYFWQIAEWERADIDAVDGLLHHFRGRIDRDNWVGQARSLAAQPGAAQRPYS